MLMQSSDLATAYYLKEQFYDVMSSKSRDEAQKKLRKFILSAQASQLNEFKACLTMLSNWSKYILNAFECPYSNGFTEGSNNKIKVIKRNAYGYRNFVNLENHLIIYALVYILILIFLINKNLHSKQVSRLQSTHEDKALTPVCHADKK